MFLFSILAKKDFKYHWPAVSGQTRHWAKTRYWIKPEAPFLSRRCQMSECKELIQLTAARSFLSEPLKTKGSTTASHETNLEQVRLKWSKSSLCHGLLLICAQHNHYEGCLISQISALFNILSCYLGTIHNNTTYITDMWVPPAH